MHASIPAARALTLLCLTTSGCSEHSQAPSEAPATKQVEAPPASPTPRAAALSGAEQATVERAKERAKAFGGKLKAALTGALQEGGPVAAMKLCSEEAQPMTDEAQGDDVALGRASLRLRNPKNRPPAWVQAQLEAWGERPAAGLDPVVQHGERDMRVMIPLAVEGLCVTCHGPADALPPGVKAVLDERYPDDRATGYAVGDLRGVLWASARIEPDPR